eukprot:GHVR01078634.1.p2 GENE.GHVR01078634.1~~GHVR01078634.1.p2  ORF type:complete len:104 (+),score=40.09 GHVR01078634.1:138-449(+)
MRVCVCVCVFLLCDKFNKVCAFNGAISSTRRPSTSVKFLFVLSRCTNTFVKFRNRGTFLAICLVHSLASLGLTLLDNGTVCTRVCVCVCVGVCVCVCVYVCMC